MKILFICFLLTSTMAIPSIEKFKSGVFEPPRMAPEFELQGSHGSDVKLSRYRGKVVLLEFGFTHCTTVCPITLSKLKNVFKKLGDSSKEVQMVFVTVDPERDTLRRLREHLKPFHSAFVGATGTPAQIDSVNEEYGVFAKKIASLTGYEVHHSSSIYLIDRQGRLRVLIPFGKSAEDIFHDVRLLLKESRS